MNMTDKEFYEKLEKHPELRNRFKEILSIADNSGSELITRADDAELHVIGQMRKLGKETLQELASIEAGRLARNMESQKNDAKKHVKKNSGGIRHLEQ